MQNGKKYFVMTSLCVQIHVKMILASKLISVFLHARIGDDSPPTYLSMKIPPFGIIFVH